MSYNQQEKAILLKVGNTIRATRKAQGIAQEELAYRADVARAYMGNVERGESNVSLLLLRRIAETLNVPLSHFFK
jgi:transcriptional regulator with XRE-family HTH domain